MIDTLRPQLLKDYVGQNKIKENLKVFLRAALDRRESLDHALFYGPPGLGKTTIAYIVANEMGVPLQSVSGPTLEKPGDLVAILTNQQEGSVLFIDEIHRIPRVVEEFLYSAMEDFQIDIVIGEGETSQAIKLDIPRFTLIGATTRAGMLTAPLRDRFGIVCRMEYYTEKELVHIVKRSAALMEFEMTQEGALEVARRSRSTPRIANRLLRRVRDFAEIKGDGTATKEIADLALSSLEIDNKGLDQMDQHVLLTIMEKFGGGPVGLETLAAVVGEEKDTLEDVVEPYLMQNGFLSRTPRGRTVTEIAYRHFGRSRSGFLVES